MVELAILYDSTISIGIWLPIDYVISYYTWQSTGISYLLMVPFPKRMHSTPEITNLINLSLGPAFPQCMFKKQNTTRMEQTHNPTYKKNKQIKHTTFWALVFFGDLLGPLVLLISCSYIVVLSSWIITRLFLGCCSTPLMLLLTSFCVIAQFFQCFWMFLHGFLVFLKLLFNSFCIVVQFFLSSYSIPFGSSRVIVKIFLLLFKCFVATWHLEHCCLASCCFNLCPSSCTFLTQHPCVLIPFVLLLVSLIFSHLCCVCLGMRSLDPLDQVVFSIL